MPFLSVNDIQLHYTQTGQGQAVVFLHGLGSSAADWQLQIPVFSEHYRVITLDLRAHGKSAGLGTRFTVETMAADVAALLAQLNAPPAHVVGLSLGGCVAQYLALRHAACVRSLVLVNTFARLTPAGARGAWRMLARIWLLLTAPMPSMAAYIARGLFPKPEQEPYRAAAIASLGKNSKRAYWAAINILRTFDSRAQLRALQCPTLIIAGDRDTTIPLSAKEALCRAIPGAPMLVIPDSGHATPYDQTEQFNQALFTFFAAH